MAKKNRVCLTCGEKYSYCPNCNRKAPSWMSEFHDENCKNIFQICTSFNVGVMSKSEAKTALEQCDLSNKSHFAECVQRDIENIFAEDFKIKRNKKIEPMAQEPMVEETESHEVVNKTEEE